MSANNTILTIEIPKISPNSESPNYYYSICIYKKIHFCLKSN